MLDLLLHKPQLGTSHQSACYVDVIFYEHNDRYIRDIIIALKSIKLLLVYNYYNSLNLGSCHLGPSCTSKMRVYTYFL